MKCSICGLDENDLLNKKHEALQQISSEIARLSHEQDVFIQKWKEENGCTDLIKEELKQISGDLTSITSQAFLDNVPSFIKLDSRLQIVQDYCDKFGITQTQYLKRSGGVINNISEYMLPPPKKEAGTIADIIALILQEPFPERVAKELKSIQQELQEFTQAKHDLEAMSSLFKQKILSPDIYGFSYSVTASLKRLSEKTHQHLFPSNTIVLCPTCSALFKEAASASFALEQAKKMANEDIWDDDD